MNSSEDNPKNLLHKPEVYEQEFELDTSSLDKEGIERLRAEAGKVSALRIGQVLDDSLQLDRVTAWLKYIFCRVVIYLAPSGQCTREAIGHKFTTVRDVGEDSKGQAEAVESEA